MSYLMIDLDKAVMPLHEVSLAAAAVYVFVKRKRHRRLAGELAKRHRVVRVVEVKSREKLARVLIKQLKKILKKDKTAGIVVMSRRKKVARGMNQLLNRYPDAEMILLENKLKKQKIIQAAVSEAMPETQVPSSPAAPKQLAKPASVPLLAPPKRRQPEKAPAEKAVEQRLVKVVVNEELVQKALNVLRKNRPRQREALVRLLTHHLNLKGNNMTPLLDELEKVGAVQMLEKGMVKYAV